MVLVESVVGAGVGAGLTGLVASRLSSDVSKSHALVFAVGSMAGVYAAMVL